MQDVDPIALNTEILACSGIEGLASLVRTRVQDFSSANVATAFNMAAELQGSAPEAAQQLAQDVLSEVAVQHLGAMRARELTSTLWALGKLGLQPRNGLVPRLLVLSKPKLGEFHAQDLANTVWALATLGYHDDGFVAALVYAAKAKLGEFKPQELAIMASALARLGYPDDGFLSALAHAAEEHAEVRDPVSLCRVTLNPKS